MSRQRLTVMATMSLIGPLLGSAAWAQPPAPPDLWLPSQNVFELQAGARLEFRASATAGADFELAPFISHFVGVRLGASWCGSSEDRRYSPNEFGARAQLTASWWRFELAFGPILLEHEDYYNSQHWRARFEHWSNAGTSPHNVGRNMALLDYRF
jgi:hypothetical protein